MSSDFGRYGMNPDCVILTGGTIEPKFVRRLLHLPEDGQKGKRADGTLPGIIAADRGLAVCTALGMKPDIIVGDFDSAPEGLLPFWEQQPGVLLKKFPPEKDWTDTELALQEALAAGWKQIVILGAFGSRIDHVLGNLQLLPVALSHGASVILLDEKNRITLHRKPFRILRKEQWGTYVSLFAFGGNVTGLTLKGFKYGLSDALLRPFGALAVSNEIVEEEASVSFLDGLLLVAETGD